MKEKHMPGMPPEKMPMKMPKMPKMPMPMKPGEMGEHMKPKKK